MNETDPLLVQLIEDTFIDNIQETVFLLQKYNIDECFVQLLKALDNNDILASMNFESALTSISSTFLTSINSRISKIIDEEEKHRVKYVVSELSTAVLINLNGSSKITSSQLLDAITTGLKTTCSVNGWNYKELNRIMRFNFLHSFTARNVQQSVSTAKRKLTADNICYYEWKGREEFLDELSYNLKDCKAIRSIIEFKKLFTEHNGKIHVRFNSEYLETIVVLFDELHNRKLIQAKGIKAKHFTPLSKYAVDLDKEFLFKNGVKQIKYGIKKNVAKHMKLKDYVLKWIQNYS